MKESASKSWFIEVESLVIFVCKVFISMGGVVCKVELVSTIGVTVWYVFESKACVLKVVSPLVEILISLIFKVGFGAISKVGPAVWKVFESKIWVVELLSIVDAVCKTLISKEGVEVVPKVERDFSPLKPEV